MGKHLIIAIVLALSAGMALANNGKGSGHGNGIGTRHALEQRAPSPEKAPTAARSYRYSGI